MTVNVSPSKFDICLFSGLIFNFACVTANYWPTTPVAPSGSLGNVYSDPVRIMGSYPSSSPYYPPNYSYSSRMEPSYGPPRSDSFYGGNRYPSPGPSAGYPSGYGYSYNQPQSAPTSYGPQPVPHNPGGYNGGYNRFPPSSTAPPYYYRPSPGSYSQPSNQIPYQYWRTPPTQYDAFDRRGSIYGVPSSPYHNGGSPYPGQMPYGISAGMPYGTPDYYGPRTAYAKLKAKDSKVEGEVRLVQQDNRYVGITGRILGLVPGAHGLHVHEGSEKDGSCENIGPHFNPMNSDHGGKSEWKRHVGDLGNVFADQDGVAYFSIIDSLISLTGPNSVLNRTLVVTEFGDDLGKGADQSKINGNAGKPISCGIILISLTL